MVLANAIREKLGTYKMSAQRMVASGKIWPNGEFSLGYSRVGQSNEQEQEWLWCNAPTGLTEEELDVRLEFFHNWLESVADVYLVSAQLALKGLTLSNAPNSHKPPRAAKYGLKGLSGNGTRMIRSGCHLLEQKLGKDDCVMITLTVPTLGREARVRLAEQWGKVTNRLVQYLTRELVRQGRPPAVVGCVEIQTARLKRYSQGYLHLHLVCPAFSNAGRRWAIDANDLRTWWTKCIERYAGTTLSNLARVETAIVEKSVEAYLGKYLSKGSGAELESFVGDLGEGAVPGQWWFASAAMKAAIKRDTAQGQNAGAVLDAVVNYLLEEGTGDGFEYVRHIDCDMGGRLVTVGYVGRLSLELRNEIFAMLDRSR